MRAHDDTDAGYRNDAHGLCWLPYRGVKYVARIDTGEWIRPESNRRPPHCERGALPSELRTQKFLSLGVSAEIIPQRRIGAKRPVDSEAKLSRRTIDARAKCVRRVGNARKIAPDRFYARGPVLKNQKGFSGLPISRATALSVTPPSRQA